MGLVEIYTTIITTQGAIRLKSNVLLEHRFDPLTLRGNRSSIKNPERISEPDSKMADLNLVLDAWSDTY